MDFEHWYRCTVCGHLYTPQQIHALIQLRESRAGMSFDPDDPLFCRKKGCTGTLVPTADLYRDSRR